MFKNFINFFVNSLSELSFDSLIDKLGSAFLKIRKNASCKAIYIAIYDSFMAFFSIFFTLYLKIGDEFLNYSSQFLLKNIIVFGLCAIASFHYYQTHKSTWKHISIGDLSTLSMSILITHILYFPLMLLLAGDESFSKFVPLINVFVLIFLLNTPRLIVRLIHDQYIFKKKNGRRLFSIPVLIIGDEDHSETYITDIRFSDDSPYDPVGILTLCETDDKGLSIQGVPILGLLKDLEIILPSLEKSPRQLIIVDSNLDKNTIKEISQIAKKYNLSTLRIPQHVELDLIDEEGLSEQEDSIKNAS